MDLLRSVWGVRLLALSLAHCMYSVITAFPLSLCPLYGGLTLHMSPFPDFTLLNLSHARCIIIAHLPSILCFFTSYCVPALVSRLTCILLYAKSLLIIIILNNSDLQTYIYTHICIYSPIARHYFKHFILSPHYNALS